MKQLWFAYGSSLSARVRDAWSRAHGSDPDAIRFVTTAFLPDVGLVLSARSLEARGGVLSLVARRGQLVAGAVFDVRDDVWPALDQGQGVPRFRDRFATVALTPDGAELPVWADAVRLERPPGDEELAPDDLDAVREGLVGLGLPTAALDAAARGQDAPEVAEGLFVYGTLMRGESRAGLLPSLGLEAVRSARTRGRLLDLGAYPGLILPAGDEEWVRGELVRLRAVASAFRALDRVEGFRGFGAPGSLYRRALIEVDVGEGPPRRAWTYVYNRRPRPGQDPLFIRSGDWRQR